MPNYQYQPLEHEDSIRVLILHSALNESDPISCTIRHVRLSDESLKYEALSYTWGDNTQRHAIYIDDGTSELSVGKNCYDALRRLRRQHKDRKVWIDATCINQENLEERACQVRIMDVVYKKAIRVVIFLGEQVTECRALFEELAAIDEILDPWDRSYRPTRSETIIKQLENLFELPWFKRVWVLQEVHHKFVIFMYGSAKASFQAFERLYYKFWLPPHEINPWPIAMRGVCHRSIEMSTPQATLWSRLFDSRDCLATDPRDKVFALKALTGSRQSELSPLVNYSQSPAECFKQVAIFLLPVLGLRLLIAVRHPHGMDMPSWVPDWSQNLPLNRRDYAEIEPTREQNCEIRSSLDNENKICLELLITGSRYAKIVERSSVFMFDGVEDARKQMTHFYYSFDNLRKFVEAGDIHSNVNVEDMLGKNIADAISLMDSFQLHCYLHRGQRVTLYEKRKAFWNPKSVKSSITSLQQCSLSLMDNGELAIVPAKAQDGDVMCVLSGSVSACLLRLDGSGRWILISGDCYPFTENFRREGGTEFEYSEYTASHKDCAEQFRIK